MRKFLLSPAIELMFSTAPPQALAISGAASCMRRKTENTFSSKVRWKSWICMSKGLGPPPLRC